MQDVLGRYVSVPCSLRAGNAIEHTSSWASLSRWYGNYAHGNLHSRDGTRGGRAESSNGIARVVKGSGSDSNVYRYLELDESAALRCVRADIVAKAQACR